jgi:hypothetical protein
MTMALSNHPYSSLWRLAVWQQPLKLIPQEEARSLLHRLELEHQEPCRDTDRHLRSLTGQDGLLGLLCLRCRTSHVALWTLRDLVAQCAWVLKATQRDHMARPELAELAGFILDDEGHLDPDGPAAARPHSPFLLRLVRDLWDPSRGELSSFARRTVKGHQAIKKHLLNSYGIALIGPWAFLASAGSERVMQQHWDQHGKPSLSTAQAIALLRAFLVAYKEAKLDYRRRTGKISGWLPDDAFLLRVDPQTPPKTTKERLLWLVKFFQIRKYGPLQQSLDRADGDADADPGAALVEMDAIAPVPTEGTGDPLDQAEDRDNLILSEEVGDVAYRILLESISFPATYKPAQQRIANNGERFLCVCRGQARGRSILGDEPQAPLNQRQIACDCHTSQPTVQRDQTILNEWAEVIAFEAMARLQRLSPHPNFQHLGAAIADTEAMAARLAYVLRTPLHPGEEAPLCSAIDTHLHGS